MATDWFPAVLVLFAGSGAAALIYEIVWLQLLQLVVGSSTVSMGVLLATFMGGLCAGSLAAPRLIPRRAHPLRVYAWLEVSVALMSTMLLFAMPLVDRVYAAWGGEGGAGLLFRAAVASVCLFPPTVAMGATLPVVARWVAFTPRSVARLGFLYAANIAGAVAGSLVAGFYLLRVYDMAIATYVGVGLNLVAAVVSTAIAARESAGNRGRVEVRAVRQDAYDPRDTNQRAYAVIAISGFSALTAEVVWTRLLALLFGATVYAFSIILGVFMLGLALGSAAGSVLAKKVARPALALGWCQLLAAPAVAWSAYMLMAVLPHWRMPATDNIWTTLGIDVGRALLAILPAPILWGASFPLALASARGTAAGDVSEHVSDDRDPARVVGRVYAANTLGAIAGALGASLVFVATIGSQHTQQMMIALSAIAGIIALHEVRSSRAVLRSSRTVLRSRTALHVALAVAAVIVFAGIVPPLPGLLVAYGRHAANWTGRAGDIVYVGEGVSSSVAVSRTADGVLNYHNAGKVQASSEPQDMRLQRMLGHLTTLVPASPRSVLVIGCGAGVTAGAVSVDPGVERVTIAEIEPLVPKAAGQYFGSVNADVIRNPKVRVRIDDARHYLLTTKDTFDAITSDPLDPWVKGAAMLYTKDFFELAKEHLNPGGVMTLFVQLYESSPDTVRSEMATFFDAFPDAVIFGNTYDGATADTVLVGQAGPMAIDLDAIEWRLTQPAYAALRLSLGQIGLFSGVELFANYGGRAPELAEWLHGSSINRDLNLRLQYLAGLGLDRHAANLIYADILKRRTFPDDIFVGSISTTTWLRELMEGPRE